jgi:hypothetical protein
VKQVAAVSKTMSKPRSVRDDWRRGNPESKGTQGGRRLAERAETPRMIRLGILKPGLSSKKYFLDR